MVTTTIVIPPLETPRLILRKLTLDDAEDMFRYACDPELTQYLSWDPHQNVEISRQFLASVVQRYKANEPANWGVVDKATATLIGTCGFVKWMQAHSHAEIGLALSRSYWGRGLMTEAVRAILRFSFDTMGLNRIYALCHSENIASQRVLKKVGMKCEGLLRQHIFLKGQFRDMKLYGMLKEDP